MKKKWHPEELKKLKHTAVLTERFYVPNSEITTKMLDRYTVELDDYDVDIDEFGDQVAVDKHILGYSEFNRVTAFHRGDLAKHEKVFSRVYRDIKVVDARANPKMKNKYDCSIKLYPDQKRVGREWLDHEYGIIKAPPRYGKTLLLLKLALHLKRKTLVLAHQQDLLDQFYKTVKEYTNVLDYENGIGYLTSKRWGDIKKYDICLSTWQLFNKSGKASMRRYRDAFGLVIVDEVHRSSSDCYRKVVGKFNPHYRLGCTATDKRKDQTEQHAFDILGPVVAEGKMDKVPCHIYVHKTGIDPGLGKMFAWHTLERALASSKKRNDLIIKWIQKDIKDDKHAFILIASRRIFHLEMLVKKLHRLDITAVAFRGGSKRNKLLDDIRKGKYKVVVANRQMLEGINVPRWSIFYNVHPTSNAPQYEQEMSRVRTPFTITQINRKTGKKRSWTKTRALYRDFVDDIGACYGCMKTRMKVYEKEKSEYEDTYGETDNFFIRYINDAMADNRIVKKGIFRD